MPLVLFPEGVLRPAKKIDNRLWDPEAVIFEETKLVPGKSFSATRSESARHTDLVVTEEGGVELAFHAARGLYVRSWSSVTELLKELEITKGIIIG